MKIGSKNVDRDFYLDRMAEERVQSLLENPWNNEPKSWKK